LCARSHDQGTNTADEIAFLGYGFPATDIGNLLFFLEYKPKIGHVVVLEPDDESGQRSLKRLQHIFGKDVVRNQDVKDFLAETYLRT